QRRFKNMNNFGRAAGISMPRCGVRILMSLWGLALLFAIWPQGVFALQDAQAPPQAGPPAEQAPPYTQSTPEQLQQLVAPIALYPDSLVAQILAASTFPEQVVQADRWVQEHQDLRGDALGQAVDQQPWDPSVKALTAFPSVLGNMDKNLSWTSSLGDAYYNQQQDVMDAVQVMRQRAEKAGDLRTTPQQVVTTQDSTISVQPTNPEVVYVPAYDPWEAYGDPIMAWPGWYPYPGIWYGGPYLSFGAGFGIGFFGGFGWGWPHWGFDWHNRYATFGGGRYYSRSNTFYNRSSYYRGGGARGGAYNRGGGAPGGVSNRNSINRGGGAGGGGFNRPGPAASPFNGNRQAARGYTAPRGQSGTRSGAFSGIEKGGQTKSYSARGSSSLGGGASRGGGGGGAQRGGGGGGGSRGGGGGHH
ncbi:MAG: DUF3300 domain-containing protein, partial [Acidobacteriota bacterium]|nr:DUF3300 domain-containing protein [Acidobacteriota bacterium]